MTHELVSAILGVRRESVTAAAGRLQRAGVLSYRRGHITVVERLGLEAVACECYFVVKRAYSRLRANLPHNDGRPMANGDHDLTHSVDMAETLHRSASPDSHVG